MSETQSHSPRLAALSLAMALVTILPLALPTAAAETDGYAFECVAGDVLRAVVWNAQVSAHGACAVAIAECDATSQPMPYASCSGKSASVIVADGAGHCGYDGYGAPETFSVTCWADASTPYDGPAVPSTSPSATSQFVCRAGEYVHVVLQGAYPEGGYDGVAQASCGSLASTTCANTGTPQRTCANTGKVAAQDGIGTCRYWGSGVGSWGFAPVCWTDADPTIGTPGEPRPDSPETQVFVAVNRMIDLIPSLTP